MRILSILFILFSAFVANAQTGVLATFGENEYDHATDMIVTSDQNYLICGNGSFSALGSGAAFVALVDTNGTVIWQNVYGDSTAFVNAVAEAQDSGYVLTGRINATDSTHHDTWVVRIDDDGSVMWTAVDTGFGHEEGADILAADDKGFYVAGYTTSIGPTSNNMMLEKFDSLGNLQWKKSYGGFNRDRALAMIEANDGGLILAGYSDNNGSRDVYVVKTDSLGGLQIQNLIGGTGEQVATSIVAVNAGYTVAGYHRPDSNSDYDAQITLIENDLDSVWQRTHGNADDEQVNHIAHTSPQGYILSGWSDDGSGNRSMFLLEADVFGQEVWSQRSGFENAVATTQEADGEFTVLGSGWLTSATKTDIVLLRTDALGVHIENPTLPTIQVFPNPFGQAIDIRTDREIKSTICYDLSGRELWNSSGIHSNTANIPTLHIPSGVFLVKLEFQDGSFETLKLLKQH